MTLSLASIVIYSSESIPLSRDQFVYIRSKSSELPIFIPTQQPISSELNQFHINSIKTILTMTYSEIRYGLIETQLLLSQINGSSKEGRITDRYSQADKSRLSGRFSENHRRMAFIESDDNIHRI